VKRETAWRVFAGEYNDSTVEIRNEGEKTPSYVVTPLGAKINRLFIIGVLTDVENVSEGGDLLRAHVSDPTGIFTLYSGQFQPKATQALSDIEVPAFVAVIGKSRTYTPEEGVVYVSIRPERVIEVNAELRDHWILETCKKTKDRIEAITEATKMNQPNAYDLRKLGYSRELSEGIVTAMKNYQDVNVNKYLTLINESLQYLVPGKVTLPDLTIEEKRDEIHKEKPLEEPKLDEKQEPSSEIKDSIESSKKEVKIEPEKKVEETNDKEFEEIENNVLEIIKKIEGEDGASWDSITDKCEKAGIDKNSIEEAITSIMDKGLIYEPILGTIKTT
jgi:RPA family protein